MHSYANVIETGNKWKTITLQKSLDKSTAYPWHMPKTHVIHSVNYFEVKTIALKVIMF